MPCGHVKNIEETLRALSGNILLVERVDDSVSACCKGEWSMKRDGRKTEFTYTCDTCKKVCETVFRKTLRLTCILCKEEWEEPVHGLTGDK